jgi:SAM-dependent methyltransferase
MNITFINPFNQQLLSLKDNTLTDASGQSFPKVEGVYRFVENANYTGNFGFQWNKFQKTQIDRESHNGQSRERFFAVTNWDKQDLTGQNVLEVGSGAGRFSQIVLDFTKANLYSVDYSSAVEANFRNNGHHGNRFQLFQASIYELPFAKNSFDKVFCFGVLQHTPDFRKSVNALIEMVKPDGELVVDFYPVKGWWTKIHAKYLFRPFTKKLSNEKLLALIEKNADWLIKCSFFFDKVGLGKVFNRFLPICDIKSTLPSHLSPEQLREWVILDTFDMFSPEYDQPQRLETVKKWFEDAGMKDIKADFISYGNGNSVAVVKGKK